MPVLTSLSKLKTHLDIVSSDSSEDNLLNQLINEIEETIFGYVGRGSELGSNQTFTEYLDGNGRDYLFVRYFPLTSITSLSVDSAGNYGVPTNAFATSTDWTEGTDFGIPHIDESEENRGKIVSLGSLDFKVSPSIFPRGRGNIKIVYTAGYCTPPKDLQNAVHQLTAAVRQGASKGGVLASETIGRYSYRLLSGSDTDGGGGLEMMLVRSVLGRYMT